MNQKKLIKKIKEIQSAVSDIPYLNSGGCGFFAQKTSEILNELGLSAIPWTVDFFSPSKEDMESPKRLIQYCYHVVIVIKYKSRYLVFDSEQIKWYREVSESKFALYDKELKIAKCSPPKNTFKSLVYDFTHLWNTAFCAGRYRPEIEKRIKNILTT